MHVAIVLIISLVQLGPSRESMAEIWRSTLHPWIYLEIDIQNELLCRAISLSWLESPYRIFKAVRPLEDAVLDLLCSSAAFR